MRKGTSLKASTCCIPDSRTCFFNALGLIQLSLFYGQLQVVVVLGIFVLIQL